MTWLEYIERKVHLAEALDEGQCGGSYADACLITAALLSGIASDLWPGKGKDQRRFVELWTRHSDPKLNPNLISVPLLSQSLWASQRINEAKAIEDARPQMFGPGYDARILIGPEVDMPEAEVLGLAPGLTVPEVRRYSYPAVFYEHVRSAITHEYHTGGSATEFPMRDDGPVSYSNQVKAGVSERVIHFQIPWVGQIVRSVAVAAEPIIDARTMAQPGTWWIDGG
jgi:hypothetical protein